MQWAARQDFDRRAGRQQTWGSALLLLAAALLLWLGYLLLVPFTVNDYQREVSCESLVFYDGSTASYAQDCLAEREWPELLALGALSVPPAVAGAALFTSGSTRKQASAHALRVIELQQSEERAKRKSLGPQSQEKKS